MPVTPEVFQKATDLFLTHWGTPDHWYRNAFLEDVTLIVRFSPGIFTRLTFTTDSGGRIFEYRVETALGNTAIYEKRGKLTQLPAFIGLLRNATTEADCVECICAALVKCFGFAVDAAQSWAYLEDHTPSFYHLRRVIAALPLFHSNRIVMGSPRVGRKDPKSSSFYLFNPVAPQMEPLLSAEILLHNSGTITWSDEETDKEEEVTPSEVVFRIMDDSLSKKHPDSLFRILGAYKASRFHGRVYLKQAPEDRRRNWAMALLHLDKPLPSTTPGHPVPGGAPLLEFDKGGGEEGLHTVDPNAQMMTSWYVPWEPYTFASLRTRLGLPEADSVKERDDIQYTLIQEYEAGWSVQRINLNDKDPKDQYTLREESESSVFYLLVDTKE